MHASHTHATNHQTRSFTLHYTHRHDTTRHDTTHVETAQDARPDSQTKRTKKIRASRPSSRVPASFIHSYTSHMMSTQHPSKTHSATPCAEVKRSRPTHTSLTLPTRTCGNPISIPAPHRTFCFYSITHMSCNMRRKRRFIQRLYHPCPFLGIGCLISGGMLSLMRFVFVLHDGWDGWGSKVLCTVSDSDWDHVNS
jgi:hypothetical protein